MDKFLWRNRNPIVTIREQVHWLQQILPNDPWSFDLLAGYLQVWALGLGLLYKRVIILVLV